MDDIRKESGQNHEVNLWFRAKISNSQKSEIQLPKSEINSYFCAVNLVVAHCTSYNCFHGAEPQSNRHFNYSFFYYYDH